VDGKRAGLIWLSKQLTGEKMTKVIYTFIRYLLTAAGASEAVISNDTVMQFASALVSIGCALWGLYESRKHARLAAESGGDDEDVPPGGALAAVVICALSLPVTALLTGCTTTTSTSSTGATVATKAVDWTVVDYAVQKSVKYSVAAVLNNNPDYATAVGTINAGVAALLVGTPTEASLIASIKAMKTGLDDNNVALIAGALKDACDLYMLKSGRATLLASDATVQAIVKAVTDGIAEGVALHNAVSTSTSAS
jgi:hypothetical protein